VYILDKERNLRGRKKVKDYKEGYSTFSPAELSNEMLDDFKVLYEYRAALKKIIMLQSNYKFKLYV
jgi:hypothetical protein